MKNRLKVNTEVYTTATVPKKGLKTRPYSMDMNKDIATVPKKGLKTRPYSMDMNKSELKKLSKSKLIELLLKQKKKPKVVIVDDTKPMRPNRPTQTVKLRRKQKVVDDRPGWVRNPATNRWIKIDGPTYRRLYPMQHVLNEQKNKDRLLKNNHLISMTNIRA